MKRLAFDKQLPTVWPFPSDAALAAARAHQPVKPLPKPKKKARVYDPDHTDARAKPVTVQGIYFPSLAAAAAHFDVPRATAQARIHRGWAPEAAVSEPIRKVLH